MSETVAENEGTSSAQKGKVDTLLKMQARVECIIHERTSGEGVSMSILQLWDKTQQYTKKLIKSRAAVWGISAAMTISVYRYCAGLACLERGYQAYGGECLAALAAGVVTWRIMTGRKRGDGDGLLP